MQKWQCTLCPYVYDPVLGDPEADIPPGTTFDELPNDWVCPECGAAKEFFEPLTDELRMTSQGRARGCDVREQPAEKERRWSLSDIASASQMHIAHAR